MRSSFLANLMNSTRSSEPIGPEPDASLIAPTALVPGWLARWLQPRKGALRALRHRNYRLFWTGNFVSNIGTWMHHLALGWLVLEMTNSPLLLGLVGFAQFAPALLFSLPGGVIADRVNRRRWLLATHSAMLVLALTLAILTWLGIINYSTILILTFLLGSTSAVNAPAYQAMVRDLSSREDVLNAIALNSIQFNLSRFIGPIIAGILLSTVGVVACFFVNALSFLCPLVALSLLHYHVERNAHATSGLRGIGEGFRYLRSHPQLLLLVGLVAMASLFGMPYLTFLPVFARDILEVGARGLGYMVSASGVGALLGGVVLATWREDRRRGPLVIGGALLFFSSVLLLALSHNFYLSLAALVLAGGSMVCAVATVNSLIQHLVPDAVRGRVLSWHTMAYLGFHPVGSLLVGSLASHWGTGPVLAVSAALPLLATVVFVATTPWLRRLQ